VQVLVALGGNLNNQGLRPAQMIRVAFDQMQALGLQVEIKSRLFTNPAFPAGSGPDYVNAVALLRVAPDLTPDSTFSHLSAVENAHGRQRQQRWGGRSLDIDILAMGDLVWPDLPCFRHWAGLDPALQRQLAPEQMIVPHPRLQDRAFVLVPLMDVAPEWRHPVWGKTVRQMLAELPPADIASVIPLDD